MDNKQVKAGTKNCCVYTKVLSVYTKKIQSMPFPWNGQPTVYVLSNLMWISDQINDHVKLRTLFNFVQFTDSFHENMLWLLSGILVHASMCIPNRFFFLSDSVRLWKADLWWRCVESVFVLPLSSKVVSSLLQIPIFFYCFKSNMIVQNVAQINHLFWIYSGGLKALYPSEFRSSSSSNNHYVWNNENMLH